MHVVEYLWITKLPRTEASSFFVTMAVAKLEGWEKGYRIPRSAYLKGTAIDDGAKSPLSLVSQGPSFPSKSPLPQAKKNRVAPPLASACDYDSSIKLLPLPPCKVVDSSSPLPPSPLPGNPFPVCCYMVQVGPLWSRKIPEEAWTRKPLRPRIAPCS